MAMRTIQIMCFFGDLGFTIWNMFNVAKIIIIIDIVIIFIISFDVEIKAVECDRVFIQPSRCMNVTLP